MDLQNIPLCKHGVTDQDYECLECKAETRYCHELHDVNEEGCEEIHCTYQAGHGGECETHN